jgi:hypothetical protein
MRRLLLAALGVFAVAGVASAQQPQVPQYPTSGVAAVAGSPVRPAAGATVIQGSGGCTNCGPAKSGCGFTMSNVTGGNCLLGYGGCQNGCGSVKSDFAFHFGTCKQFFSPCGPTCGGLWSKCDKLPLAAPWGCGWGCPRAYDSYTNH